eukprot:s1224_g1.t2
MADDHGPVVIEPAPPPEQELVERPRAALDASPGKAHGAASAGFETAGVPTSVLQQIKQDILHRLDSQDVVLQQLLQRAERQRILVPKRAGTTGTAESSKASASPKQRGSELDDIADDSPIFYDEAPLAESKAELFSTFTSDNLAHLDAAYNADAGRSRDRFKDAKSFTSTASPHMRCLQRMVKNTSFDIFCAFVVVSNSIFLGIEVQASIDGNGAAPPELDSARYIYTAWFIIELALRMAADGPRQYLCSDDWAWSALDVFVVTTSIWELVADIMFLLLDDDVGNVASVSGLRAFRIIRITRVVKAVRLMRVFRFVMAFRTLITSILYTLKSLFWALMLLIVIVYVFGVLFTQAVNDFLLDNAATMPLTKSDEELARNYFGSLQDAMLSLFMSIAGGVSWEAVIRPLRAVSEFWGALFVFYISFTLFAVLNVVTGVFCQSAIESAQNDHTAVVHSILKNKKAHVDKIKALFSQLGDEKTGAITFAMFEEKIHSPAVQAYFEVLGLDVWDAWSFFKLLDLDNGGEVEVEEFLMGCLRLRGPARAIDVGKVIHDQSWLMRNQGRFFTYVEAELNRIVRQLAALTGSPVGSMEMATTESAAEGAQPGSVEKAKEPKDEEEASKAI